MTLSDVASFIGHVVINGSINAAVCVAIGFGIALLSTGTPDERFERGAWWSDALVSAGLIPLWRLLFPKKERPDA